MMNEGLSAGDILALTRDQDGMGNAWNNPFIYLVWLALLGGNGGLFGRRDDNTLQSSLTRSDLFEGFNNQDINSQLRGITNGLCDGFYAVNNGLKDGFYGNQGTMKDGFYGIQGALAENRFAQQNCCCEIKSGIKDLSAEGYRNTCEITTAIHAEGSSFLFPIYDFNFFITSLTYIFSDSDSVSFIFSKTYIKPILCQLAH